MGFVKVFQMDANGAGYVDIRDLSTSDRIDIEMAILTGNSGVLCHVCKIEIPRGTGNSCTAHKGAKGSI